MKARRLVMGMPVTVEVLADESTATAAIDRVFEWLHEVDTLFSTYTPGSTISRINRGELAEADSPEMVREVLAKCRELKSVTGGYFDAWRGGRVDPSGYVKGWAVWQASRLVEAAGGRNYFIDAGGDIQAGGRAQHGGPWRVGIRNPFKLGEIVKVLEVLDGAVATSGTYERGEHIYDPHSGKPARAVASVSVVGPRIDEADVWATAAFAAGEQGARMVAQAGLECYVVGLDGVATLTGHLPILTQ